MQKIALALACFACVTVRTSAKRLDASAEPGSHSLNSLAPLLQALSKAAAFNPPSPSIGFRGARPALNTPQAVAHRGAFTSMSTSMSEQEVKDMGPTELQAVVDKLKAERDAKDAIIAEKDKEILSMKDHVPTDSEESVEANEIFVDVDAKLAEKQFKIPPAELIHLAKRFLVSNSGFGADPELLSEDFKFVAPVVGPLSKETFVNAIGSVDIKTGFPDFKGEFYGFHVDPFEGNRVWYTARGRGTNTGPFPPFAPTPTGRSVVNPPQACSVTFNEEGLVTKYTIGYVMDREVGNTGGLGGIYGVLYAIGRGLPFPEAQPWRPSPPYALFQQVGNLASKVLGN